jgi:hypothetical protein
MPQKSRRTVSETASIEGEGVSPPPRPRRPSESKSSSRTSSSQSPEATHAFSSQWPSYSSYFSFTGEPYPPPANPPDSVPTLPSLASIVAVQSRTSPDRRFDGPPRSRTSPRVHLTHPPHPQPQSASCVPTRTRDGQFPVPPLLYGSPSSSSYPHSERDLPHGPALSSPLPLTRTHPRRQRSHSTQNSPPRSYPPQRPTRDARRLSPSFETTLSHPAPPAPRSQPVSRSTPRPPLASRYQSVHTPPEALPHHHPLWFHREMIPMPSADRFSQSRCNRRSPVFFQRLPPPQPPTRDPSSLAPPFWATSFVYPSSSQFALHDSAHAPSLTTCPLTRRPWSNVEDQPQLHHPYLNEPPTARFPGHPYSSDHRRYSRRNPYAEPQYDAPEPRLQTPLPLPPPPLSSPVYDTRSHSFRAFDAPNYAAHQVDAPTNQSSSRRRRPPQPYSSYANMLGDIINQHRRRKMTLQEIYTRLREKHGNHFPDEDDDTKVFRIGGGWRVNPLFPKSFTSHCSC